MTPKASAVAQLLRSAAGGIDYATATASAEDGDSTALDRLNSYNYLGITCSLEELAAELRHLARYVEEGPPLWSVTYVVDEGWRDALEAHRETTEQHETFRLIRAERHHES